MRPHIDGGRCTGCGACVRACPLRDIVIGLSEAGDGRKAVVLDASLCDLGKACARACPTKAFRFVD
jgi:NAD-dependent dihydropyrimidine dehydrogenase PreA subunit